MENKVNVSELDIVYISYDEPRCEEFWADLLEKVPWAERVHGVKGFDNAHKEAAKMAETDRFITVDGDNIVNPEFFELVLDITNYKEKDVFSWGGKNVVNGLVYGNGGLKCWPREHVLNMKTHENAETEQNEIDFCWEFNYIQMNNFYSDVYSNGSPYESFRAGFREGVKLSLDRGFKVNPKQFKYSINDKNLFRLLIWCSIGSDVENGLWSIYGARLGTYLTVLTDWDIRNIRDFDWFEKYWNEEIIPKFQGDDHKCIHSKFEWSESKLSEAIEDLGNYLQKDVGLNIAFADQDTSKFFKSVYINPMRTAPMVTEQEIDNK